MVPQIQTMSTGQNNGNIVFFSEFPNPPITLDLVETRSDLQRRGVGPQLICYSVDRQSVVRHIQKSNQSE